MLVEIISIVLFSTQVQSVPCNTPNNETAQCISLYECTTLLKSLESQSPDSIEFVEKSHCGVWINEPLVCCGTKSNFVKNKLFDESACGYQHSDDYYTNDLLTPSLDEYPWLVLFMYNGVSSRCAGALINYRYVLTAARCLQTKPSTVRLGEYDVSKSQDCAKDGDYTVCADNIVDVKIEEIIIHPLHNDLLKLNDIGLVRLQEDVYFSDYIRPICLPSKYRHLPKAESIMYASGFGLTPTKNSFVDVKKKVMLSYVSKEACSMTLDCKNVTGSSCDQLICTTERDENWNHICDDDYGGPLMVFRKRQWYVQGIYSWRSGDCRSREPVYFTKVSQYSDWIKENVRL